MNKMTDAELAAILPPEYIRNEAGFSILDNHAGDDEAKQHYEARLKDAFYAMAARVGELKDSNPTQALAYLQAWDFVTDPKRAYAEKSWLLTGGAFDKRDALMDKIEPYLLAVDMGVNTLKGSDTHLKRDADGQFALPALMDGEYAKAFVAKLDQVPVQTQNVLFSYMLNSLDDIELSPEVVAKLRTQVPDVEFAQVLAKPAVFGEVTITQLTSPSDAFSRGAPASMIDKALSNEHRALFNITSSHTGQYIGTTMYQLEPSKGIDGGVYLMGTHVNDDSEFENARFTRDKMLFTYKLGHMPETIGYEPQSQIHDGSFSRDTLDIHSSMAPFPYQGLGVTAAMLVLKHASPASFTPAALTALCSEGFKQKSAGVLVDASMLSAEVEKHGVEIDSALTSLINSGTTNVGEWLKHDAMPEEPKVISGVKHSR
jgi:hypothetical protein